MPGSLRIVSMCAGLLMCAAAYGLAQVEENIAPTTASQFVEVFKQAFAEKSPAKAQALFYWHRVSQAQRALIVRMINRDLAAELIEIKVLPLGSGPTGYQDETENYRPNANLVGHLLASFVDASGAVHHSMHMVGVANGVYYIALPVPDSIRAVLYIPRQFGE